MSRVLAILVALCAIACARSASAPIAEAAPAPQTQQQPPASTSDAKTVADFQARLKAYTDLHNAAEKTLPALPKETNPTVIDTHQRALEALLRERRKTAKRGDVFGPDGERLVRRILGQIFRGAEGAKLKATIMDENPTTLKLAINSRYPDEVPLSTMPPQVLAMLPKLPDDLEYRFIGDRLILLDVHAHTIADYIENVLPV